MQDPIDTVLICGEAPLESEANASIRGSIQDGWVDLLSAGRVFSTSLESVVAAIHAIRPSLLLCIGSYLPQTAYFGEACEAARQGGAVTVFWATEDPYEKDASYRIEQHFDVIFTCDRWTRNFYDHPKVFHLPLAACPRRHYVEMAPASSEDLPIDLLFCGVAFANRREIMRHLQPHLAGLRVSVIGPGWGDFGPGFSEQRVDKARLIALYAQSKIVLNLGRSLNFENTRYQIAPSTPGPRTFEAAMAGALQFFHEDTAEIRSYFNDDEVPCFSSPLEFAALCKHFLGSDALRRSTAARAQQHALREHGYAHRASRMIEILTAESLL